MVCPASERFTLNSGLFMPTRITSVSQTLFFVWSEERIMSSGQSVCAARQRAGKVNQSDERQVHRSFCPLRPSPPSNRSACIPDGPHESTLSVWTNHNVYLSNLAAPAEACLCQDKRVHQTELRRVFFLSSIPLPTSCPELPVARAFKVCLRAPGVLC